MTSLPPSSVEPALISRLLPSRLRFALLVMLGAYPLIAALFVLIGPLVADWPMMARPLPIVPLMVIGMVYLVIPAVHRVGGGWIARGAR